MKCEQSEHVELPGCYGCGVGVCSSLFHGTTDWKTSDKQTPCLFTILQIERLRFSFVSRSVDSWGGCDSESQCSLGQLLYHISLFWGTALSISLSTTSRFVICVTLTSIKYHQMSLVICIFWVFATKFGLLHPTFQAIRRVACFCWDSQFLSVFAVRSIHEASSRRTTVVQSRYLSGKGYMALTYI